MKRVNVKCCYYDGLGPCGEVTEAADGKYVLAEEAAELEAALKDRVGGIIAGFDLDTRMAENDKRITALEATLPTLRSLLMRIDAIARIADDAPSTAGLRLYAMRKEIEAVLK